MKRFFAIITVVSMILMVGCVDLDDLWSEINLLKQKNSEQLKELGEQKEEFASLEELLASLEQVTTNVNSEISSIKGLIDALTNNVGV
ncbi:MAG: hypothetical protein GXY75_07200, partial [Bacteroidales bacterium]|nr:hypothetical protein [Bacteroidales bacterium]